MFQSFWRICLCWWLPKTSESERVIDPPFISDPTQTNCWMSKCQQPLPHPHHSQPSHPLTSPAVLCRPPCQIRSLISLRARWSPCLGSTRMVRGPGTRSVQSSATVRFDRRTCWASSRCSLYSRPIDSFCTLRWNLPGPSPGYPSSRRNWSRWCCPSRSGSRCIWLWSAGLPPQPAWLPRCSPIVLWLTNLFCPFFSFSFFSWILFLSLT